MCGIECYMCLLKSKTGYVVCSDCKKIFCKDCKQTVFINACTKCFWCLKKKCQTKK